jgi:hypothetical protein
VARSFAGGTDKLAWGGSGWNHVVGAIHFWMKTTQATVNAVPVALWTSGSRNGFGFLLNNTANKLTVQGYPGTGTPAINMASSATINDGNWHSCLLNWNTANGGTNTLYMDGVSVATANSSASWAIQSFSVPLTLGRADDAFWGSFVGQIAELAVWLDRNLTTDEVVALSKGFSPLVVGRASADASNNLTFYAPLVRDPSNLMNAFITGPTGTTVSDHPRVIGL